MNCQDLFSLKNKKKKNNFECRLLQILLGALRVKGENENTKRCLTLPMCKPVKLQKYKCRYPENVTITKQRLPEAPEEGGMRNKQQ